MKPPRFTSRFLRTVDLSRLALVTLFGLGSSLICRLPAAEVNFNHDIRPIFNKHCVACHGGVKQAGGISFIYREKALQEAKSGAVPIVPGDAEASELFRRITENDPDERMPPPEHGPALDAESISLMEAWIEQGADWEEHWAFVPPGHPDIPAVEREEWCRSELDRFVLRRLENEGLEPSLDAERVSWLRRVSFDLTGLPPTPAAIKAFQLDHRPDAYERVVDRLLASPRFGERWASLWLDLSRFADTMGYEKDPHRDIWPYRDWLIRVLNDDMPYDEFLVRQLAGDLLENPTMDELVATAFHRNTQTNTEGGTDDEEFRIAAVIDRVNTTWQVFAGTTFGCVQCHSHPYDPIEHDEYYQFFSYFNNSRDADLSSDEPRLSVPVTHDRFDEATRLDRRVSRLLREQHDLVWNTAEQTGWTALEPVSAKSTGSTQLAVHDDPAGGPGREIIASGTISAGSVFTIDAPVPPESRPLTAFRIEVLPTEPESARRTPEEGFILSRFRAEIVVPPADDRSQAQISEVPLAMVYADEAEPMLNPDDSLRDNPWGWGANSKLFHAREALVLVSEPTAVPPGAHLRLTLKHDVSAVGDVPLVIRRARVAISDSPRWSELIGSDELVNSRQQLSEARGERSGIESVALPVMEERRTEAGRDTFVFTRGNWLAKGKEVERNVPDVFQQPTANASEKAVPGDRLELARWFASPEHPLTARVEANRIWEQLFGTGLVETLEDFGSAGTPPSHPELLDHLAVRFSRDFGWSRKQLLREIVLSSTYRQSARSTPELNRRDPRNRLLARGPRQRLTAEMVRDQALAVSGLLSDKMFGPSVMPPQPDGVWRVIYSGAQWVTAEGENRYRRGLYTYWRRTSAYPSFLTFDAPSREVCSMRRISTNTPLQALVTMNDPVYLEAAAALADRMAEEAGSELTDRLVHGHRLVSGRNPKDEVLAELTSLHADALEEFKADPDASAELGESPEKAALAVVASTLLNLDLALTR